MDGARQKQLQKKKLDVLFKVYIGYIQVRSFLFSVFVNDPTYRGETASS